MPGVFPGDLDSSPKESDTLEALASQLLRVNRQVDFSEALSGHLLQLPVFGSQAYSEIKPFIDGLNSIIAQNAKLVNYFY